MLAVGRRLTKVDANKHSGELLLNCSSASGSSASSATHNVPDAPRILDVLWGCFRDHTYNSDSVTFGSNRASLKEKCLFPKLYTPQEYDMKYIAKVEQILHDDIHKVVVAFHDNEMIANNMPLPTRVEIEVGEAGDALSLSG
jgi:hypothetical protein